MERSGSLSLLYLTDFINNLWPSRECCSMCVEDRVCPGRWETNKVSVSIHPSPLPPLIPHHPSLLLSHIHPSRLPSTHPPIHHFFYPFISHYPAFSYLSLSIHLSITSSLSKFISPSIPPLLHHTSIPPSTHIPYLPLPPTPVPTLTIHPCTDLLFHPSLALFIGGYGLPYTNGKSPYGK